MTSEQKRYLVLGGIGAAIIAALFLARKSGGTQSVSSTTADVPETGGTAAPLYLTYNIGGPGTGGGIPAASGLILPSSTSGDGSQVCGCQQNSYVTSINDLMDQWFAGAEKAMSDYTQEVYAQFPDYMRQYIDNTAAVQFGGYNG